MGRPPLRKKGAFTAAERQRRRRARLRKEKREAEVDAMRARSLKKLRASQAKAEAEGYPEWTVALPVPPLDNPADELALQIADLLESERNITIDELRDALDRRFGPRRPKGHPGA